MIVKDKLPQIIAILFILGVAGYLLVQWHIRSVPKANVIITVLDCDPRHASDGACAPVDGDGLCFVQGSLKDGQGRLGTDRYKLDLAWAPQELADTLNQKVGNFTIKYSVFTTNESGINTPVFNGSNGIGIVGGPPLEIPFTPDFASSLQPGLYTLFITAAPDRPIEGAYWSANLRLIIADRSTYAVNPNFCDQVMYPGT